MNKKTLLARLLDRLPYTKTELEYLFEVLQQVMVEGLSEDGRVSTPLGVFSLKKRKSRKIIDINSKEERILPERIDVKFKPNDKITESINEETETERR